MSQKKTPTQSNNAGALSNVVHSERVNHSPKALKRQEKCKNCRHYCSPIKRGKLLPERTFCYCTGKHTTPHMRACSLFAAEVQA